MMDLKEANPIHAMLDLLMSERYGLGLDAADIDAAQIDAAAAILDAENGGISPLITEAAAARGLMTRFTEYFDGVLHYRSGGLLRIELARNPASDITTYPLIGEYDLTEIPDITSSPWTDTTNEVWVKYSSRRQRYQQDAEVWRDLANLQINGEPITRTLDRPWICDRNLAHKLARAYGRLQSVPLISGRLSVRKAVAATITVGSFIRFTYQDHDQTILFRVLSKTTPEDRAVSVDLEVMSDRYYDAISEYEPDEDPASEETEIAPALVHHGRVVELPNPLLPNRAETDEIYLAAIAARNSGTSVKLKVFASESGDPYRRVNVLKSFARTGQLAGAYAASSVIDTSAAGILVDLIGPDNAAVVDATFPSVTTRQWMRGELLLLIGDEWMSYKTATIVSATQVRLTNIRRGLFGTTAATHADNAQILVIKRKLITPFTSETFRKGEVIDFKLAPATNRATTPLADITPLTVTLAGRNKRPLDPINLRVGGTGIDPTYSAGDDHNIKVDITNHRLGTDWFDLWDEPYSDLHLKIRFEIWNAAGSSRKRIKKLEVGESQWIYTSAQRLADFGGSNPDSFLVRAYAIKRGRRSAEYQQHQVRKTGTAAVVSRTTMYPSDLSDILGAVAPGAIMERNFDLAAARWSITLPHAATDLATSDDAPAQITANFAALATAASITLEDVSASQEPRVTAEYNWQLLNAAW
jgi:hypothetical protein